MRGSAAFCRIPDPRATTHRCARGSANLITRAAKILRAANLLAVAGVGSTVMPQCGKGMLRPRRLGHRQNLSSQDPSQFSDRL